MKPQTYAMHVLDGTIVDRYVTAGLPATFRSRSAASDPLHGRSDLPATCFSLRLLLLILLFCVSAACWAQNDPPAQADASYRLDAGDKLQIDVFNQADLTGEYTLDGNGRFSMHLIGKVEASGLTVAELEMLLISKLKPDYLVNPRVSVQVQNYRPYYLIGEVLSTGPFPYVDGMTYMKAVAIAGGFTYRARKGHVYVVRGGDSNGEERKLDVNEKVRPGDIIRVAERIF